MSELATKTCVPCKGGVPPLKGAELQKLLKQLTKWKVVEEHHLTANGVVRNRGKQAKIGQGGRRSGHALGRPRRCGRADPDQERDRYHPDHETATPHEQRP